MFTSNHSVGYVAHRAVVRVTNASTGICQVEIPELTGAGVLTYVSNIGLSMVAGLYNVPAVGSTVFVASNRVSDRVFFVSEQRNGIADTLSTTLVTSKGGTGASAYVAGDTIYAATTGASAFTRLAKGTANQVVGMNAAATAPEYKTVAGTTDQVVVTHAANSVTLSTPQSINTTSAPTFASATLNNAAGVKLALGGVTSNWLEWNNAGLGAPATTTRSVGTKAVLYPSLDASNADYAIGINSGTLWSSAPTGASFKWFSNATSIASLAPTGALTTTSFIASAMSTFAATGEAVRMSGNNPYLSMWDTGAAVRTGYLQGVVGSDVRLVADSGSPLILIGATSVQVRDGTLTTARTTVNSSGLTVNAGAFTVTNGEISTSTGNALIGGRGSPQMQLGTVWSPGGTLSTAHSAITVTGMTGGNGYGMLMTTSDTFISSGSGGTYIRGPANDASHQVQVSNTVVTVAGGLTVSSGGFTITAGGVSMNANGAQRLAINGTSGAVAINMAVANGGNVCTPDGFGVMTTVASRQVLKERIQSIPNSDSTARIMGLRPVEFYFKRGVLSDDNEYTSLHLQRGFVAEEVALVDHYLASWGWVDPEDEYRTLSIELMDNQPDLNDAVPVMWNLFATIADVVGALQGALTRIEYLETQIP